MEISQDTIAVINVLDSYTKGSIRKKSDLTYILEICASYNLTQEIESLIFNGKVFGNLYKTLKKYEPGDKSLVGIQIEFEETLEKLKNVLSTIQTYSDADFAKRLEVTYLEMRKGCVLNLVDLCYDLGQFKDMQSEAKRTNIRFENTSTLNNSENSSSENSLDSQENN